MVEAIGLTVRQAADEGVLLGQRGKELFGVRVPGDEARHLGGKLVREAHHREKLALPPRQRIDHSGGEHAVDVRALVGEGPALRDRAQVQIDRGKPALARVEQLVDLSVRKLRPAAVRVDSQLRVVEAELLRANLVDPAAEPQQLCHRQKSVAAGDDEMDVFRQTARQRAEEARCAPVGQQVEVVEEDVAGPFTGERVAEVVGQQAPAGGVGGAGIIPQELQPRVAERILHALPEDGEIVGVDADAHDARRFRLRALAEIPVHGRGLSVAHRRDNGRQRAAGDGPQTLLQPLGDVDGVQVLLAFCHFASLHFPFMISDPALRRKPSRANRQKTAAKLLLRGDF